MPNPCRLGVEKTRLMKLPLNALLILIFVGGNSWGAVPDDWPALPEPERLYLMDYFGTDSSNWNILAPTTQREALAKARHEASSRQKALRSLVAAVKQARTLEALSQAREQMRVDIFFMRSFKIWQADGLPVMRKLWGFSVLRDHAAVEEMLPQDLKWAKGNLDASQFAGIQAAWHQIGVSYGDPVRHQNKFRFLKDGGPQSSSPRSRRVLGA